ncbi:unnamed protein product, partial [Heterosigma akashiwo]
VRRLPGGGRWCRRRAAGSSTPAACHDQEQGHKMDRYRIHTMKCMGCEETQPVGQYCRNKACKYSKEPLSRYYCAICKLFDDAPGKAIYHCPYCNLCR